jgi:parallel beta-helix repeat protein
MNNAHPFLHYSTIKNNNASGIYAYNLSSKLRIINCTIRDNTSISSGGGICIEYGESLISNSSIINNSSNPGGVWRSGGGGISVFSGTTEILGDTISDNTVTNSWNGGGGIQTSGCEATISNNTICNNFGGGIELGDSKGIVLHNAIRNNHSPGLGGGINIWGGWDAITVSSNIISENKANDCGGGIAIDWESSGTIPINVLGNIIENNNAINNGGGIYLPHGNSTIFRNSIIGNSSQNGCAIYYVSNSSQSIQYNTISDNRATGTAPTYTVYILKNSISSYNNIFGNAATYDLWNDNPHSSSNLNVTNNWWGTVNVSEIQSVIYDWFDDATKGIVDYAPFLTSPDTAAPVSPPSGFTLTSGSGKIILHWSANPESDITGYKIYYDTKQGYSYVFCKDVGNKTTDTIAGLSAGTYYFAITAYDVYKDGIDDQVEGHESWFSEAKSGTITGVDYEPYNTLPHQFNLMQNYPNPFNPSTTIRYALPYRSHVKIKIFNMLGQEVLELIDAQQEAGYFEKVWNAKVASGLYLYRLEAISVVDPHKQFIDVKKMVLLK